MSWRPVRILDIRPAADKAFEPEDPFELVGVPYPSHPEADHTIARCIVEEYALVGWGPADIRRLFTSPNYAALYAMFCRHGSEFVEQAIAAVFTDRGGS